MVEGKERKVKVGIGITGLQNNERQNQKGGKYSEEKQRQEGVGGMSPIYMSDGYRFIYEFLVKT